MIGLTNGELLRTYEKFMVFFVRYYPNNFLEILRKTMKILDQYIFSGYRNQKPGFIQHES